LYALSGNLKKFEIKGKDDNDFLFKSWQEFVKGEEKTKTKNFKNFDELLGKMFDSDWLNNCMRGNEKNDKEDEDKVIKCAKKIQEKLKEKKNRELSNESRVGKFSGKHGGVSNFPTFSDVTLIMRDKNKLSTPIIGF